MLTQPPNFLAVRRITGTAHLLNRADAVYIDILDDPSGIYDSAGIIVNSTLPGMVPPFDEETARRKAGYTKPEWRALDWVDRAIEVAMYRIDNKIQAIFNEKQRDESRSKR